MPPYSCENVVARRWVLVHSGLWSDWRLESNWARLVGSLLRGTLAWTLFGPGRQTILCILEARDDFWSSGCLSSSFDLSKNKNCIINCYFILPIWGLGALPPVGSRGKAPGRGTGSEAPEADSIFYDQSMIRASEFAYLTALRVYHLTKCIFTYIRPRFGSFMQTSCYYSFNKRGRRY